MGAKLPTRNPSGADQGSEMFGIEHQGEKIQTYRGYKQDIAPIIKRVDMMREAKDLAVNKHRQIKPRASIPVVLLYEFAKEKGKLPSQILRDPELRKALHKRVLTDPDYKRLVV